MQHPVRPTVRNQKWLLHVNVCATAKKHTQLSTEQHLNQIWWILLVKVLLLKLQPLCQKEVSIF